MQGKELFEANTAKWIAGRSAGRTSAVELATALGRAQLILDAQAGLIPTTIIGFHELHDHVDANMYGTSADWPALSADADDAEYVAAEIDFWDKVRDELDAFIVSGEFRKRASC